MNIKEQLRSIYRLMSVFGFNPLKTLRSIRGLPFYHRDLKEFNRQKKSSSDSFKFGNPFLCLEERFSDSGDIKGAYFHQDLLVARRIFLNKPKIHVDVGSRIDGFVGHVAAFRDIEVIDIRPLSNTLDNIHFIQLDLMQELPEKFTEYCDSLSCLHALEHFGLGRYGDPVNYDGHLVGLDNLYKILKKTGKFYLSVPIGPQRVEFNAHRVFSVKYLVDLFRNRFRIDHFSFVNDKGDLHKNIEITDDRIMNNFDCNYGCGIFEMTKL